MKEIASFHIYSELLAPHYQDRHHCVPREAFDRISELGKVEDPKNSYSAKVEVGSDEFEEIVDILKGLGAVLKDSARTVEGATISVGRSLVFDEEDIASAKLLRLVLKKGIIDLDPPAWRQGTFVSDGKGKPSFKFGFADMGHDFAASEAFLEKLNGQGFAGIKSHQVHTPSGEPSGFHVLRSETEAPPTCGGYLIDNYEWTASPDAVETNQCFIPGTKHSPEILVYPDGALDHLDAHYVQTSEKFGRTFDRGNWKLVNQDMYKFLTKNKIKMEVLPVLEEQHYRACVTGRMDEIMG